MGWTFPLLSVPDNGADDDNGIDKLVSPGFWYPTRDRKLTKPKIFTIKKEIEMKVALKIATL